MENANYKAASERYYDEIDAAILTRDPAAQEAANHRFDLIEKQYLQAEHSVPSERAALLRHLVRSIDAENGLTKIAEQAAADIEAGADIAGLEETLRLVDCLAIFWEKEQAYRYMYVYEPSIFLQALRSMIANLIGSNEPRKLQ